MDEFAVDTGSVNVVHVEPLLLEYFTRYSVIAEPPVLTGATHVTASWVLPRTATTAVGLPGTTARIPIEFCETNTSIFELSLAELAPEPLDAAERVNDFETTAERI